MPTSFFLTPNLSNREERNNNDSGWGLLLFKFIEKNVNNCFRNCQSCTPFKILMNPQW